MNNVALDIAIGLVFIYLLYSLLATTIKELIATIFSYRGRMLEIGIEQMLDGENYSYYWWDKVINFILWIRVWLIEIFELEERKKYHEWKKDTDNIPADEKKIISETSFSKYKNEYSTKKGSVAKEIIKRQVFFSKIHIPKTSSGKERLRVKLNKKSRLFAAKITQHALYKRSAENSLFFKKPAYLNSAVFSDILINILGSDKSTHLNEPALMKDIAAYVNSGIKGNPELQKILKIYIEQANGDLQRFKFLIESWYDDTMERVSGWYKRQANTILMIIGLALAIYGNIDTVKICNILANNKEVREQLASLATKTKDNYKNEVDRIRKESVQQNDSVIKGKNGMKDTVLRATIQYEKLSDEQLKKNYDKINGDINEADNVLGLGWYMNDSCRECDAKLKPAIDSLHKQLNKLEKAKTKKEIILATKEQIKTQEDKIKECYKEFKLPFNGYSIVGWIITALAISLGAPFWFDLLNKFINLRVSGAKPEEAKKDGTSSKTKGLNQKPNPKAFA